MLTFNTRKLSNGIELKTMRTEKFKTVTVELFIHHNLGPDAGWLALLPQVLLQGTQNYPTMQMIGKRLDSLYGAELFKNMQKKGERQLLNLRLEMANAKYLGAGETVWDEGMQLLAEVLLRPQLEEGSFVTRYVEQEKQNLAQQIRSLINDKRLYAAKRCVEEMCRDERYHYYQYGAADGLEDISAAELFAYYRRIITANPITLYVVGDVDEAAVAAAVEKYFGYPRTAAAAMLPTEVIAAPARQDTVVETEPISQGKLVIGYRTGTSIADEDYVPLLVCNSILGGGGNSKLFLNVREKASLAYYASSQLEVVKGLLFVSAGIEAGNFRQAVDIIDRQVADIQNGQVTGDELSHSKRLLAQSLQKTGDVPDGLINFALLDEITGKPRSIAEMTAAVERVTVDDVVRVGSRIRKDLTYFLRNEEGGEQG